MMVLDALGHALSLAAAMSWEILWTLILGFAISAAVQVVVSKAEMGRLLPDDSPRSLSIAGALGAWVPASFWQGFFLADRPLLAKLWGPLVGPLVAMLSFVCSIGNVPLAAVLWNGGISFGGVVAFIFADLIVLPILNIYRKYYGPRVSLYLLGTFYTTMVVAGLAVETLFGILGLIPDQRDAEVV